MSHVLIKYGEIALKGKNRKGFETQLIKSMREALNHKVKFSTSKGRIYIDNIEEGDIEKLQKVFGVVEICPSFKTQLNFKSVRDVVIEELGKLDYKNKTFRVTTRRINKSFDYRSMDFSRDLGAEILREFSELSVDLHNPDIDIEVELRKEAEIYLERFKGPRGMPYPGTGKTLVLLSGGIDSPVAMYQMARRGVKPTCVHFHIAPFSSELEKKKVEDIVKSLKPYLGEVILYHINILEIQKEISKKIPKTHFTLMQRRSMMRLATRLARSRKIKSLTTGENIGQVSSQTMSAIHCINDATNLPVFRPLISFDKNDIVDIAKEIDTYDISILPYDDCCSLFAPGKVDISPKLSEVLELEKSMDLEEIENQAFINKEKVVI